MRKVWGEIDALWKRVLHMEFRVSEQGGGVVTAVHSASHSEGGSDEVDVTDLGGFPGGSPLTYLDSDGNFTDPGSGGPVNVNDLVGFPGGSPLTYLDSDGNFTTPDTGGGGSGSVIVAVKTADETVNNSTTFQDDDHLTFTVTANTIYRVECMLLIESTSVTPDIKFQWTLPASANIYWGTDTDNNSTGDAGGGWAQVNPSGGSKLALRTNSSILSNTSMNNPHGLLIKGVLVVAGTGGTVTLQWAQNVATAEDTKLLIGSNLVAIQVTP